MTFLLLTGRSPFFSETTMLEFELIMSANYTFHEREDEHVTPLARDFISKLLVLDETKRMTIKVALNHEWIRSNNKSVVPILGITPNYEKHVAERSSVW